MTLLEIILYSVLGAGVLFYIIVRGKYYVKSHVNLVKVIIATIKTKPKVSKWGKIIKNLIVLYLNFLLSEYKQTVNYFTPKMRLKRKNEKNAKELQKVYNAAIRLLKYQEAAMKEKKWSKKKTKQFWTDFTKNYKVRQETLEDWLKVVKKMYRGL